MKTGIVMICLFTVASSALAGEILFRDDFNCYGDAPPQAVFCDACTIGELPPALHRLQLRPKDEKRASVYTRGMFKLPDNAQVANYEFSLKFEFPRDSKKTFDLDLFAKGDEGKLKQAKYTVVVNENGLSFRNGLPAPNAPTQTAGFKDLDLPGLAQTGWNELKIRSHGRSLELFLKQSGRFVRFGIGETLGTPLTGFNLSSNTSVDFDDIEVSALSSSTAEVTEKRLGPANGPTTYEIELPPDMGKLSTAIKIGWFKAGLNIKLVDESGKEKVISGKIMPISFTRVVTQNIYELDDKTGKYSEKPVQKQVPETYALPDAYIRFTGLNAGPRDAIDYFFRPQLGKMDPDMQSSYAREWTSLPGASEKFIKYEFRLLGTKSLEAWIDGRYAGEIKLESDLKKISFELPAGAAIQEFTLVKKSNASAFLPLDLSTANALPGAFAKAEPVTGGFLSRKRGGGESAIAGIPFLVLSGPENLDMGNIRNIWGDEWGGERYWSRNPYNGARENIIFPVPNRQYSRAWILCAIEDDPAKEPVLTARLTRYGGLIGPQIADTSLRLPSEGEALPEGLTKVGVIKVNDKSLPLYLAEIKLASGKIQDLIFQSIQPGVLNDSNMSKLSRSEAIIFM